MNMTAVVSVIMPAYNVGKYIGRTIESVLAQTYENFELIVINDGSEDDTENVVRGYMKKDARIKYIKQVNQGVSVARNTGIDAAGGKYISFLDGDDLWHKDFLKKMTALVYAGENSINFAYARTEECFPDGSRKIIGGDGIINGYLEDFVAPNNELRLKFHISALLINKDIIEQHMIRFVPGQRLSEDTGFFIECLAVCQGCGIDDVLSYYIRREGQATGNNVWHPEFWIGHADIYDKIEAFVYMARPKAKIAFDKARSYVAYRFVLSCLKNGYIDEAAKYRAKWRKWLKFFSKGDGKRKDRYKCMAILKAGRSGLKLIGKV